MKTLIIVAYDYANAAYKIYDAIRRCGGDVRLWSQFDLKRPGYCYDLLSWKKSEEAKTLAREADVIHFVDQGCPLVLWKDAYPSWLRDLLLKKPCVLTLNRSVWYFNTDHPKRIQLLDGIKKSGVSLTTITARVPLSIPYKYIPQPIDVREILPEVEKPSLRNRNMRVVHSVYGDMKRGKMKGTEMIRAAVKNIPWVDFKIINGVTYEQSLALRRAADVLIDQINVGSYASYSMLEMACMAKPVIHHLKENMYPILRCDNTGSDIPNILNSLRNVNYMWQIGLDTRKWVESTHSYEVVGQQWLAHYADLMKG